MLKSVQVQEVIVPRIVAALQRRHWRFLMKDARGTELWIDSTRSRELELKPSRASRAEITVLRYRRPVASKTNEATP